MSPSLADRVQGLADAVKLTDGRLPDEVVEQAATVVKRAGQRVAFSGDHTVVALAGATGSGKSSSFNAITGSKLAETGVKRPTTSEAMAVAWGTEMPHELLDWLDVPRRHLIASQGHEFANLVLLDLPDHDSTELEHRMTVDRLVELVDMLVWIVDPQKYADAALHDNYLKPLAPYSDIMVVVLNQADRLTPDQLQRCIADLRRLLDSEGLGKTPVMTMSAVEGTGVDELRGVLANAVAQKRAVAKRLGADVSVAAAALSKELGDRATARIGKDDQKALVQSLAEASGVPIVVEGVLKAWRQRGVLATGWPMINWVARLKPDPLKRLRIGLSPKELSPTAVSRTSLPGATSVQKAKVDSGLRRLFESATTGLPRRWADAVRSAARDNEPLLLDNLDTAIATTDLNMHSGRGWWALMRVLQWILFAAVVVGALWLFSGPLLAYLQLPPLPPVTWWGFPAPTVLLVGGVAAGILLAALSRIGVEIGARSRAAAARRELQASIAQVTEKQILQPVRTELERYHRAVDAVKRAA